MPRNAPPEPNLTSETGDVLALGEDRPLVAVDLLDAPPGTIGHLVGAQTRPDHGLDVPGPRHALHLDLQLPHVGAVPPSRGSQWLIELDAVAVP
ncbi:MAG: hypothetical protein L0H25_03360 [Micrococcales bacterium]|nr:hypothetical protein [Micrococcales bacterium]